MTDQACTHTLAILMLLLLLLLLACVCVCVCVYGCVFVCDQILGFTVDELTMRKRVLEACRGPDYRIEDEDEELSQLDFTKFMHNM